MNLNSELLILFYLCVFVVQYVDSRDEIISFWQVGLGRQITQIFKVTKKNSKKLKHVGMEVQKSIQTSCRDKHKV